MNMQVGHTMGIIGAVSGACAGAYAGAEVGLKGTWIFNPALAIPGAAVGAVVGAVAGEKMMFAASNVLMGVTVGTVKVAGKVVIWPFQQLANGIKAVSGPTSSEMQSIRDYSDVKREIEEGQQQQFYKARENQRDRPDKQGSSGDDEDKEETEIENDAIEDFEIID